MYLYTFIATLQIQKYPQHFFLLFFYRRISKERGEKLITSSKISLNNYSNPRVEQFETTRSSNNFREFSLLYNPLCSRGRGRGHWEHGAERSLFSYPLRLKKKKKSRARCSRFQDSFHAKIIKNVGNASRVSHNRDLVLSSFFVKIWLPIENSFHLPRGNFDAAKLLYYISFWYKERGNREERYIDFSKKRSW